MQVGQPVTAEVIARLKEAPIPNLNPAQGQTVPQSSVAPSQPPTGSSLVSSTAESDDDFDDFASFQTAPTMSK